MKVQRISYHSYAVRNYETVTLQSSSNMPHSLFHSFIDKQCEKKDSLSLGNSWIWAQLQILKAGKSSSLHRYLRRACMYKGTVTELSLHIHHSYYFSVTNHICLTGLVLSWFTTRLKSCTCISWGSQKLFALIYSHMEIKIQIKQNDLC